MSDGESSQDITDVEEKKSEEEMEVDMIVNFDPLQKVNTWESTRLGMSITSSLMMIFNCIKLNLAMKTTLFNQDCQFLTGLN